MKRCGWFLGLMFFILSGAVLAGDGANNTDWQDTNDSTGVRGKAYFRGRPLPECKEFWILEEHFEKRMAGNFNSNENNSIFLSFEVGHMFNISRRHALGGSFYFTADDNRDHLGLRFRHRYWITKQLAWDLAPGFILSSDNTDLYNGRIQFPNLSMSTFLYISDLMALHLTFEAFKIKAVYAGQTNHNVTILYGGVTLGSYPAAVGIVATVVVAIMAVHEITVVRSPDI
jgi:hypothetical protein